ncbi:MAG TPA: hypothetical protein VFH51_01550 [Myxococcota bacterium]|nr:hypothetical protein [Myxococcota bacterium]
MAVAGWFVPGLTVMPVKDAKGSSDALISARGRMSGMVSRAAVPALIARYAALAVSTFAGS